jgi:hypothetical protein
MVEGFQASSSPGFWKNFRLSSKKISGKEDTPGRGAELCALARKQNSSVFLFPELS